MLTVPRTSEGGAWDARWQRLGHMGSMWLLLGSAWRPWESMGVHVMCTTHHLSRMLRAYGQQVGGPVK